MPCQNAGLIGEKLSHSLSQEIHSLLGGYSYTLRELKKDELGDFMRSPGFSCFNVTIPYKKAVIPYLKHLSPEALETGAVNTVISRPDGLYGYNTDVAGVICTLGEYGIDPAGKKVCVTGSGGASAAVRSALKRLGAAEIVTLSRFGETRYEDTGRYLDSDILINATPVGMYPSAGAMPVDPGAFTRLGAVFDLIYNPLETRLVTTARKSGIKAVNGLFMLVTQAAKSAELFGEAPVGRDRVREITEEIRRGFENTVIIGMPGCGKTAYGSFLATKEGRPFIDTDREIKKRMGMTPSEIINILGEEVFRDVEHSVVASLMNVRGSVISTGGGVVTREDNYYPLKCNSKIVFLDVPPDNLAAEDRPLTQKYGAQALYAQRLALYRNFADEVTAYAHCGD